jgi:plastocyanin
MAGFGVAEARPAEQAGGQVAIVDFAFNPASLTVPVGAQVTWRNTGQASHTTTATGGQWNSGTLSPGGTFSFTFSSAGSFAYRCNIHPNMMGTIVVQGGAGAAPPAAAPAQPRPQQPGAAPAQPRAQQPAAAPGAPRPAAAPAPPRTGAGTVTHDAAPGWLLLVGAGVVALGGAAGRRLRRRA